MDVKPQRKTEFLFKHSEKSIVIIRVRSQYYHKKSQKKRGRDLHFYMPWSGDIFLKQDRVNSKRSSRLPFSSQERFNKFICLLHNPHALENGKMRHKKFDVCMQNLGENLLTTQTNSSMHFFRRNTHNMYV